MSDESHPLAGLAETARKNPFGEIVIGLLVLAALVTVARTQGLGTRRLAPTVVVYPACTSSTGDVCRLRKQVLTLFSGPVKMTNGAIPLRGDLYVPK